MKQQNVVWCDLMVWCVQIANRNEWGLFPVSETMSFAQMVGICAPNACAWGRVLNRGWVWYTIEVGRTLSRHIGGFLDGTPQDRSIQPKTKRHTHSAASILDLIVGLCPCYGEPQGIVPRISKHIIFKKNHQRCILYFILGRLKKFDHIEGPPIRRVPR